MERKQQRRRHGGGGGGGLLNKLTECVTFKRERFKAQMVVMSKLTEQQIGGHRERERERERARERERESLWAPAWSRGWTEKERSWWA